MEIQTLSVHLKTCPETGVYIGTSDDIPGVCLETDSLELMKDAIRSLLPDLICTNLQIKPSELHKVVLRVFVDAESSSRESKKPRILIEDREKGTAAA